jgi:hypothetical protein
VLGLISVGVAVLGVLCAIAIPIMIEAKKRPTLRIERADDANARNRTPRFRIVHVRVVNEPITGLFGRWLLRNVANGCKVNIVFQSRSDGKSIPMQGRWSATPEPFTVVPLPTGRVDYAFDPTKIPQSLRFDLPPDSEGEVVAIAIKLDDDPNAFGFTSASYEPPHSPRIPQLQLPDEEYDVFVTARAGGISGSAEFVLTNRGKGINGLTLR